MTYSDANKKAMANGFKPETGTGVVPTSYTEAKMGDTTPSTGYSTTKVYPGGNASAPGDGRLPNVPIVKDKAKIEDVNVKPYCHTSPTLQYIRDNFANLTANGDKPFTVTVHNSATNQNYYFTLTAVADASGPMVKLTNVNGSSVTYAATKDLQTAYDQGVEQVIKLYENEKEQMRNSYITPEGTIKEIPQLENPKIQEEDPSKVYGDTTEVAKLFENNQIPKGQQYSNGWFDGSINDDLLDRMNAQLYNTFFNEWRQGGNLNGMDFAATRNLSRAADRLNNRNWWKGGNVGLNTVDGQQGYEASRTYKREPIETQEMRQMRMQEELTKHRITGDIDNALETLRWRIEAGKQSRQMLYDTLRDITKGDQKVLDDLRNAMINVKYLTPGTLKFQEAMQEFLTKVGINKDAYWSNVINNLAMNQGVEVAMITGSIVGMSHNIDTNNYYTSQFIPWFLNNSNGDFLQNTITAFEFVQALNAYKSASNTTTDNEVASSQKYSLLKNFAKQMYNVATGTAKKSLQILVPIPGLWD